jgi:hypothetical protein
MNSKTRTAWIVQIIGAVIAVAGGIPAALGTTSTGLFVLYCVVFIAGLLVVLLGRRMYTRSLKD